MGRSPHTGRSTGLAARARNWLRTAGSLAPIAGIGLLLLASRSGRRGEPPATEDARLAQRIRQQLAGLGSAAAQVDVTVAAGVATLSGLVRNSATREAVEEAARQALGPGEVVVNAVDVRQAGD